MTTQTTQSKADGARAESRAARAHQRRRLAMKHWSYDAAERVAAKNEILSFLRHNDEARTVDVAACCQHFRDEPLIVVLDFLRALEREGKVASQLHWFDESNDKAGQYYTWQLIDDALRERISDDDLQ